MPSPFPGMDPFLEDFWFDFHGSFGGYAKGVLNPNLPPDHVARVETDVYIHELSAEERQIGRRRKVAEGDASVNLLETRDVGGSATATAGGVAVAEPTAFGAIPGAFEERTRKVVIRDKFGEEVVTVIELLSPVNKVRHRDAYLQKRAALLDTPVHLVEIDLLRQGRRLPIDDCPESDLLVSISVAERRPVLDLWTIGLRDTLPVLPVPLRDGGIVPFDLRLVLDRIYEASAYDRQLYLRPPVPPLRPADAAWAAGVLTDAGVRLPPGFPPDAGGGDTAGFPPDAPAPPDPPAA